MELIKQVIDTTGDFKISMPFNVKESFLYIKNLIDSPKSKVLILGDWDVDGIHSAKIIFEDLKYFGFPVNNIEVYFGDKKTHGITSEVCDYCINHSFTHCIIVDSSSNAMNELIKLHENNINTLVIDHHVPQFKPAEYTNVCTIVNAKFTENPDLNEISAGFLCAILSKIWRFNLGIPESKENFVFGYITLISDSCKLYDSFIRPVIMYPHLLQTYLPKEVQVFTDKYTTFNRNFVVMRYNTYINNICRHDMGNTILDFFFSNKSFKELEDLAKTIKESCVDTREEVKELVKYYKEYTTEYPAIALANLDNYSDYSSLPENYIVNATGLIASKISSEINKPVIAYKTSDSNYYKMSGRDDADGFDFQDFLKYLDLDGGGHVFAIGFKMFKYDFVDFVDFISHLPKKESSSNSLIWDCRSASSHALTSIFYDVARYNEVACGSLKPIYLQVQLNSAFTMKQIGKMRLFTKGELKIKDCLSKCKLGDTILIKPNISVSNEALVLL